MKRYEGEDELFMIDIKYLMTDKMDTFYDDLVKLIEDEKNGANFNYRTHPEIFVPIWDQFKYNLEGLKYTALLPAILEMSKLLKEAINECNKQSEMDKFE